MFNSLPYRIYLDITNKCPNSCLHCYANPNPISEKELSLEELRNLVEQLVGLGIYNLIISGGEPFMRDDIYELLHICKKYNLKTVVITSGVLLNTEKIRAIKESGAHLRLSLDGVSKETHDYVRGKGSFMAFMEIINIIKRENFSNTSIHFTLNKMNLREILRLPLFLNDIGIKDITLSTIKPAGKAREHPELLIEPSLVPFAKERINIISRNRNIKLAHYAEKNWQGFSCPAAFAKCGIASDGRITPCIFLGSKFLGESIKEHSFEYLWQNDKILNKLRNLSLNNSCLNCSHLSLLHGGCRARALYFNNEDIEAVDLYCCEIGKSYSQSLNG